LTGPVNSRHSVWELPPKTDGSAAGCKYRQAVCSGGCPSIELGRAKWDDAAVRADVAAYVAENLTAAVDSDLVTLVFDETGDQKKGA
jgi:hypothetical protein